eukprot:2614429-Alexandrium_andersonii.AAC.1
MPAHQVTAASLGKAIGRLKLGKSSPDGLTAEMYKALPPAAAASLARFFTLLLATLVIPLSWTMSMAMLLPKVIGASSLAQFRAIACLVTARKILGYLWMQMLPPLRFESFQTGF